MIEDFKNRFWISLIITIPIVALAPLIQDWLGYELQFRGDHYVRFALASAIFIYGGWPFLQGTARELKCRAPGMMTLIGLAIAVAYIYSSAVVFGLSGKTFFWELATLIVVMLLGHWFEMRSVMGASNALQELAEMLPAEARRVRADGQQEAISIDEIQTDDVVLIRPGEKIPADGTVIEGESYVNEAMLTGESKPVAKHPDAEVIGGSINENGALKVKVDRTGKDAYLSQVIHLVEEAQQTKSNTQNLANRAAGWLFYLALGAGLITLVAWLASGRAFDYSLERMVTVMVISCPHALGLAVPLVAAISMAVSASNGLLIRNRTAFENARNLTMVLFDKTGTLTEGSFSVTRYKSLQEERSDDALLSLAASIESSSEHPIAAGIVRKAQSAEIAVTEPETFSNITGKGVQATLHGREIKIVSPGMVRELDLSIPEEAIQDEAETVVFLVEGGDLLGYVALADAIRQESYPAVAQLRKAGLKVAMATGDNARVAAAVQAALDLDDYFAEILPEKKQQIIKDYQDAGEILAMVGDGVNDAPALAQANVGIAIGSGTNVAAETADIILVKNNPRDIVSLIRFGSATYAKMVQNLWWAAGYNILAIPLAAGAFAAWEIILSPAVGAILMSLSTVIVAFNAQLLRRQMNVKAA